MKERTLYKLHAFASDKLGEAALSKAIKIVKEEFDQLTSDDNNMSTEERNRRLHAASEATTELYADIISKLHGKPSWTSNDRQLLSKIITVLQNDEFFQHLDNNAISKLTSLGLGLLSEREDFSVPLMPNQGSDEDLPTYDLNQELDTQASSPNGGSDHTLSEQFNNGQEESCSMGHCMDVEMPEETNNPGEEVNDDDDMQESDGGFMHVTLDLVF